MSAKNSCKTAAVMGLLSKGPTVERDVQVFAGKHRDIETITAEILDAKRVGGEAILTIGTGLIEAKATLPHGEWMSWLEDRVEISTRMAQKYMRLARHYSNTNALSYLGATKALQLLALPESERDEFLNEPHEVGGEQKSVIDMTSRELASAIKERDEALRTAAQAKADQSAAEQAREKLSQDMAFANARIEGLNAQVDEQAAKFRQAQEAADQLARELKELRSRPVDVAVQVDESAVEAARKEAEERIHAQLKQARNAREAAYKAREAAEADRAEAQKELERVRAEARTILDRDKRKEALAASGEMVLFQTLFDQVQELVNKMGGILLKSRNKDPDTSEKLSSDLLILAEKIKEMAER